MSQEPIQLGIVGATGAVGREALDVLAARDWPADQLRLFASERSAGSELDYRGRIMTVEAIDEDGAIFDELDIAIFSAGGSVSRTLAPRAVERGCTVIDNSSAFRMEPNVPLVVPEVNGDVLNTLEGPAIIANPNCSTIIALVALTPLHRIARITRMVVATYQAASGAGAAAMAELEQQARDFAADRPLKMPIFGRQYLFNLFSHDSPIGPDGSNEEERKLVRETHKIWNDDAVAISATCVRVPVLRAHSEAINLTFERDLTETDARAVLATAPGLRIVDDREHNRFPEPLNATGLDDILVGRIRADRSQPHGRGLDLFVCGDQLRKGAALNAVQILERLGAREQLEPQMHTDGHR